MNTRPLAVVTGASSGIGYELARELAQRGHDLVLTAENEAISAAAEQVERLGADVTVVRADLRDPKEVERLAEQVRQTGRTVEVLVVNAGVGASGDFVSGTTLADQLSVVDLNVRSAVHLVKLLLPDMVDHGRCRLLFTSSIAATAPGPFQTVYHASKAFLQSFGQGLREELRGHGVTVTTLMPGPTATRFFERAGMTDTKVGAGPKDPAPEVARQGLDALFAGKDRIVPGSLRNTVQTALSHVIPDRLLTAVQRKATAPGTAEPERSSR